MLGAYDCLACFITPSIAKRGPTDLNHLNFTARRAMGRDHALKRGRCRTAIALRIHGAPLRRGPIVLLMGLRYHRDRTDFACAPEFKSSPVAGYFRSSAVGIPLPSRTSLPPRSSIEIVAYTSDEHALACRPQLESRTLKEMVQPTRTCRNRDGAYGVFDRRCAFGTWVVAKRPTRSRRPAKQRGKARLQLARARRLHAQGRSTRRGDVMHRSYDDRRRTVPPRRSLACSTAPKTAAARPPFVPPRAESHRAHEWRDAAVPRGASLEDG